MKGGAVIPPARLPDRWELAYEACGPAALSDFLGDYVVFRNLKPADARLPSFAELRARLGLKNAAAPRKIDSSYGAVAAEILRLARTLDAPGSSLRRLLYVGDARLGDGTAFNGVCAAGGWPGRAFIGRDERGRPPGLEREGRLYFANRWSLLDGFLDVLEKEERFVLDEETALVIDIDKTAVGARGRNDAPIDGARVEALRRVAAGLRNGNLRETVLRAAHDELKHPDYHALTADNQDCLAYACLAVGAGVFPLEELVREVRRGGLRCFGDLLGRAEERRPALEAAGLVRIHDDVRRAFSSGDPTPFKAFRHEEYLATAARFEMRSPPDTAAALEERIFITEEVRRAASRLRARGVLVFGLSDKPDEASLPAAEGAPAGLKPLHRLETISVAERLT